MRAEWAGSPRSLVIFVAVVLFVTSLPLSQVASAEPSVVSDGFDGSGLGSMWSFVDPVGDSSVGVSGGRLSISVPAGTAHNLWTGSNDAPRLLQDAPDTDFEVIAKFDSTVSAKYQMQGLLAVADLNNLVRTDVYHDGTTTRVFAARMTNGSATPVVSTSIPDGAPVWLKLARTSNTWTLSYSFDGSAWSTAGSFSHTLAVTQVGVWAGNHTPSPAFTANVDYFLNPADPIDPPAPDTTPPVISNVDVAASVDTATVTWTTDEPATSAVASGETTSYENGTVGDPTLVTSHSITLTGLTCETLYHYQITSSDAATNTTTSSDATFTTGLCPASDSTPPVISNVDVAASVDTATVTWTTDEPATSAVASGETTSYENGTVGDPTLVTSHSITLTGLTCETLYHYQITSSDAATNTTTSSDATFTTGLCPAGGSSVVSDGFDGSGLGSMWSFVDPVGDSSVGVSGGRLSISVPAGTAHNLWTGSNDAPRLLQDAPDTDFEVIAKFDSTVSAKYQMQGLLAVADLNNLVRTDVYHDGTTTRVFAARMTNGSATPVVSTSIPDGAPVWLKLARTSNTWTLSYSFDGSAWSTAGSFSHTLAVTQVGVWAGNHTPSPAFTANVDYFLNPADPIDPPAPDTTPPVISNVDVAASVDTATVTWTTDEPATSAVASGETTSYENGPSVTPPWSPATRSP